MKPQTEGQAVTLKVEMTVDFNDSQDPIIAAAEYTDGPVFSMEELTKLNGAWRTLLLKLPQNQQRN